MLDTWLNRRIYKSFKTLRTSITELCQECYYFVIMLLLHYFLCVWELRSHTQSFGSKLTFAAKLQRFSIYAICKFYRSYIFPSPTIRFLFPLPFRYYLYVVVAPRYLFWWLLLVVFVDSLPRGKPAVSWLKSKRRFLSVTTVEWRRYMLRID